ncbi:CHASE2 domain-containing protein [Scytonema sp. UIC 10036]|uniref:CHASE2 domain-containing protein n=1 Tax=Scytonema sp. UIC 10036 TaxID=2304196 RepID=UPI0012DA33A2|nr:CHASE2 domain-containing protein [Scytonema sp. UIC 10036]MUG97501.1 CHASE2 domain-containing protein [Scytonema sp. UIC 10036]
MHLGVWKNIKDEITVWSTGALTGMIFIGLAIAVRMTGSFQYLEWLALDSLLRLRPSESVDERILIVEVKEEDIHSLKTYPVPDRELATLLLNIQAYNPRVIGLDIHRDLPVNPGRTELNAAFKSLKNLIVIEKVLPIKVEPPSGMRPEQVGFADQIPDSDGKLRRSLLGTPTPKGYKFSLSLRLVEAYLAREGLFLENGIRDRHAMRFGNTELPRFLPNSGGYVRSDAGGVQVLLNYRSGRARFRTISLNDIKTKNFNPDWIRDRIVIVGITAPSVKDYIMTAATTPNDNVPGRISGVEIQAHACSQIISAVLDSRPLLQTWSDEWEYLWIICWGILGILLARLSQSPSVHLLAVGIASTNLMAIGYLFLVWGWWVPVVPTVLVLVFNGVGLTALFQYNKGLRSRMNARQAIIEHTFETIHNGPLQTLARILRRVRDRDSQPQELLPQLEKELEKVNCELRGIYQFLQRDPLTQENSLYIGKNLEINLQDPIHEVLYQVYNYTLQRDFPCFETLKFKIRTFEPIENCLLSVEQKRGLCRFLEEALCNVGKHATGVTRLEVTCTAFKGWYTLRIVDDGLGINSYKEGRGTQQFEYIARQFKGKFRRESLLKKGTLCELSWPIAKF